MTRSIPTAERMRWISALTASILLAITLTVALHAWQVQAMQSVSGSGSSISAPSTAPLDPRIAALATRHPARPVEAIVQFKAGVTPERSRWDVARVSGHVVAQLHIINALAVRLGASKARTLAANPDVRGVALNARVTTEGGPGQPRRGSIATRELKTTYDQTLNVTGLWKSGADGAGVGVAVIDTGVDGNLPDFQTAGPGGSRVVETAVTNPNATTVKDTYGHGTDVAGIIAGNGDNLPANDPLKGEYIGVAPRANLVAIKASDDQGNATVLDVIYGLQFAVDHKSDYDIRVINLSLDSRTPQSYRTDPLDAAAEAAWMHGIVVVAAAGNQGDDSDAVQYAPANDPYVITVGAVNENGTADPADDSIAGWSSQGTTQDGFQKPDVYAPGAHIISVLAPQSTFALSCPKCVIGGDYIRTSGTSMAAPMISGLVADVLEAHPTWTPDRVKGALTAPSVASNAAIQEVDAAKVAGFSLPPTADQGLTPNSLIDARTGGIDYSRSSWSRSSWSTSTGALNAGFARSSWSCTCSTTSGDTADPSRSSWSRSSWSTYFDRTSLDG